VVVAAVLDACVLYPIGLRDVLLDIAIELGMYRPLWSATILDEVERNLVKGGRCTPDQAAGLRKAMTDTFPEAEVSGFEHLMTEMTNHPKDRHVLAAAVAGEAEIVVTSNLRDFPQEACQAVGIRRMHPDDFLCLARSLNREVDMIVQGVATRYGRHGRPVTYDSLISSLFQPAPKFAAQLLTDAYRGTA